MLAKKWNGGKYECLSAEPGLSHLLELGRAKAPTSNGQHDFELWILGFESHHALIQAQLAVARHIIGFKRAQLAILDPSKGKNDMGAKEGVNIFRQILPLFGPVL